MYNVHLKFLVRAFSACAWVCAFSTCARCVRPRSRFYRHTARPREPSWRAEGAAQGRTLHSDQSVLYKYPLLSMCDQIACLCTVGSRWNREFNLIFEKLTSYFQIVHFVSIFHLFSISQPHQACRNFSHVPTTILQQSGSIFIFWID